jgi:excisionase family DNA binding protein
MASPYLTKAEAAAYARLSPRTIQRALASGQLRSAGTEQRRLIRPEWIDEWLERRSDDDSDKD